MISIPSSLTIKTPELGASLDEADTMPSLISTGFLHLVSPISDISEVQLAPSIKSHTWCHAGMLLLSVTQAGKMVISKLIHHFSSHPAAFGFQASSTPPNIILNPTNNQTD